MTVEARIDWTISADNVSILTAFPSFGVSIRKQGIDYALTIFDKSGEVVETVRDPAVTPYLPTAYTLMGEIYDRGRRNALGIDAAIDSLLDELPDSNG